MPVKYEGNIVAVAQLINKRNGIFTKKDEDVFADFAVYAGVALRNAHLYEEVSPQFIAANILLTVIFIQTVKNREQTQVMLEAAMALSSDSELVPLLRSIMRLAKQLVDADRFSVFSVDKYSGQLFSEVSEVSTMLYYESSPSFSPLPLLQGLYFVFLLIRSKSGLCR
jgi:hypothetical protein